MITDTSLTIKELLDENGERMRLDDGQVVSDSGVVVSKSFKNALGQQGKGDFSKGKDLLV